MKKFHIYGAALVAVFAFCAISVSSAFASNPEWLIGGNPVTEQKPSITTGALELEDNKAPIIGKAAVSCEGVLDGFVGPEGKDEITEVLTTGGALIASVTLTKELVEKTGLKCKNVTGGGCEGTDSEVWPDNLPWLTQLELVNGNVVDHIFTNDSEHQPGWHIANCLVFGIATSDLCQGLTYALIENMLEGSLNDLLANFVEGVEENASCVEGTTTSGVARSINGLISSSAGVLTVSGDEVTE